MLRYDSTVTATLNKTAQRQLVIMEALKALHNKASQRASSLTGACYIVLTACISLLCIIAVYHCCVCVLLYRRGKVNEW